MASFFIYNKINKKQLSEAVVSSITGINKWFKENPKRKVCKAQWVYGEIYKVRKNSIITDIQAMALKTETI